MQKQFDLFDEEIEQKKNAETEAEYVYIVQSSLEPSKCKIGITNSLERRLKEYNSITGISKDNKFLYLFTCKVKNMNQVEKDIKAKFPELRYEKSKERYFYNDTLFNGYVDFIKTHELFVKQIHLKEKEEKTVVKIVKKTTPSMGERGTTRKELLQTAKKNKNDEFYTRYEDVEKEISMYPKNIWKNKVVFCNCDDAVGDDEKRTSAFALFFIKNFQKFELKKLICTYYAEGEDIFNQGSKGYIFNKDGFRDLNCSKNYPKNYTGSFDDPESLRILNEDADIVCTNPPFSGMRKYWKIIIDSGKKFLIISNIANPITLAFVPYFYENKVWAGYSRIDYF